MGRAGLVLIILTCAVLWYGGQKLYTALSNRKPTVATLAEYSKSRPKGDWLQLNDCRLSIIEGMHSQKYGAMQEVYIPLRAPGDEGKGKVVALLATKDTDLMQLYRGVGNLKTPEQALQYLALNDSKLSHRSVKGIVRFGIDLKDKDRRQLAALDNSLAPDFIIIDDGKEPSLLAGLGITGAGLGLLGFVAFQFIRSRREAAAPSLAT